MAEGTTPNAARKKAREHAAALLDAQDAERRRLEAARRKRVTDNVAEVAGNDAEIAQLAERTEELRADSARRLAAIVADGVSETNAAAMTSRVVREVRAAVKAASSAGQPRPARKPAAKRSAPAKPPSAMPAEHAGEAAAA